MDLAPCPTLNSVGPLGFSLNATRSARAEVQGPVPRPSPVAPADLAEPLVRVPLAVDASSRLQHGFRHLHGPRPSQAPEHDERGRPPAYPVDPLQPLLDLLEGSGLEPAFVDVLERMPDGPQVSGLAFVPDRLGQLAVLGPGQVRRLREGAIFPVVHLDGPAVAFGEGVLHGPG